MTEKEVAALLKKYAAGQCTPEEEAFMDKWYADLENRLPDQVFDHSPAAHENIWQRALEKSGDRPSNRKPIYLWAAAAAIAMIIAISIWYFHIPRVTPDTGNTQDLYAYNQANDRPAGRHKAVLTLANGKEVILNDSSTNTIKEQHGVTITKNSKGQLVYTISSGSADTRAAYNTITTPNGGQYEVFLPDGSHVILNAATTLKYPVTFSKRFRQVHLSGEAYFEIRSDASRPFLVISGTQTVKVLGTHFNISCYPHESVTTTLAEGSIQLTNGHLLPKILQPGQQATLTTDNWQVTPVDPSDVISWKDGLFVFRHTPVKSVLQQLCRWYDVEAPDTELPDITFDGEIPRDQPLSELLNVIAENSHVKFKITGRKIIQQ
ncbi:FecR family protein [Chitinophaga rhizophila]|uniref:FecR domain-containing protein n=1 Tax=Chitinophaga rhizophila TaxID=2866212 RepID=A0ABS7G5V4_9BACT|nr:FecR domain-containing protein [Chitinophaga rhizophila]MBW8683037.1 FecR domain-containing protein [Chitinophaga rhizophila]